MIDEDPRKSDFDLEYQVLTSKAAMEKGLLQKIKTLLICSEERKDRIVNTISQYEGFEPQCWYIDCKSYERCPVEKIY